ncbi:Acetoacetyl-CoA synthetase [Penicillium macrosclerotiorum]|uniref:Acetoacetyl-CoA synthetase n=1 Tax=Penicillium macrosclerotiorum TaxID=303699 RepID=UPI002549580D|nr:Acetoacetyl-CoA synthetase [Penicillium macrosclerotiorum]KAJ5679875.1 Acetoacetyl-CoA synthetase [Penicillium macrosclerotiorum]
MAVPSIPRKLWQHPDPESTQMGRFRRDLEHATGKQFNSFYELYLYSVQQRSAFWAFCLENSPLIYEGTYTRVVDESARMDSVPAWFTGIQLNFAENLLFSRGAGDTTGKEDHKIAVTEVREGDVKNAVHLTWGQLRQRTGALSQAMKANGVARGDRVAVCSANSIDTLLVFLASTAIGAIFSSSSTDMGVKGVLDRLLQIKPRWLFMDDSAVYNGKTIDLRAKMRDIVQGMGSVAEFQGVVSQPRFPSIPADVSSVPRSRTLGHFLASAGPGNNRLEFVRVGFRDPLMIVYSSGTTGQPKCIVHSVGGILLNGFKEGGLHTELGPDSVGLQYTTTGWIMYLSAVQTLLFGARVVLYDGSPFIPDVTALVTIAAQERVTHLGISPRWLHELQRAKIRPREMVDLSALQVVTSTGMVLRDELFEWFYDEGFPTHARLNNISGGTDLAGCFGISNPLGPVYVGGCAGFSLGIPVEVYDSTIEGGVGIPGVSIEDGIPGELVAPLTFPNMPTQFWGDTDGKKYFNAYFARFDNVWTHGDFVSVHPITKQLVFHGRADGVLNPSGVRFGSAEIYRVIEGQFSQEIADSICVGQRRPSDPDERVMLFLLMKPGMAFTSDLVARIKSAIRAELSARHVPTFIFETPEIPTTVNLKKVELPIKQIVSGKRIQPSGTLLNPGSLEFYYRFAEVEKLVRESKL